MTPLRRLTHPGPVGAIRVRSLAGPRSRHVRLVLAPGSCLFDAMAEPLRALGIDSASALLFGGRLDAFVYCVAAADPSGRALLAYSDPIEAGPADLVSGSASFGKDRQGRPLLHCHAAARTADGTVRGGHLVTDRCIVGAETVVALVASLDGFEVRQAFDAETNIPLFQPLERT